MSSSFGAFPASALDESQEMVLAETVQERARERQLEDVYAIMRAVEVLETAQVNDQVPPRVYAAQCASLISKFEQAVKIATTSGAMRDVGSFMSDYGVALPYAHKRLLEERVPATLVATNDGRGAQAKLIALVEESITLSDMLDLSPVLQPVLLSLQFICQTLAGYPGLPSTFSGQKVLEGWMARLRGSYSEASAYIEKGDAENLAMDVRTVIAEVKHIAQTNAEAASRLAGGQ